MRGFPSDFADISRARGVGFLHVLLVEVGSG